MLRLESPLSTHNGRSASAAGTALHAPKRTLLHQRLGRALSLRRTGKGAILVGLFIGGRIGNGNHCCKLGEKPL
jgi:hypothetical protein